MDQTISIIQVLTRKISSRPYKNRATVVLLLIFVLLFQNTLQAQVHEPYKALHGGQFKGAPVSGSPDPLVNYHWFNPKATDSLQIYKVYPARLTASPVENFKQEGDVITLYGPGDLCFDFGMENAAWLEFDSDDLNGSVTASISEYNEPAIVNAGAEHRFKTMEPKKYGHTYRLELNKELYEGVRFAWIHIKSLTKTAHIRNVRLVCQAKPVNYQGSFSCSDSMLTRIWYTGAYTVRLNLLQDYFGDILMERSDRHSWTGDAYPAQAAALSAFGNYDMIRQNLKFTSTQDNGIMAYSLYWVLSMMDYYKYTGDTEFVQSLVDNMDRRLQWAFDHFDSLPPLNFMGWDERLGAGFENPETKEAKWTYKMLCIYVWRGAADLMGLVGQKALSDKYLQFADRKTQQLLADSIGVESMGVHALSEAINAGLATNPMVKQLAGRQYTDRINRLSYSPFNQYFILQAMTKSGYLPQALTTVKDLWGGQISYGGTSFFEVFRPSWNQVLAPNAAPPNNQCGYTSLCHPWSAGVTKWLSENIAGIKPVTPGFKSFEIVPYLNARLRWVKGSTPTPSGNISAAFNIQTGTCRVVIPNGTIAQKVALPKAGKHIHSVHVNGQLLYDGTVHGVQGIHSVQKGPDYLNLMGVEPGTFNIQIAYEKETAPGLKTFQPDPFQYVITDISRDSLTSGKRIGQYGHQGYKLFGYPPNSSALTAELLPTYVRSIECHLEKNLYWDNLTTADQRAHVLQSPAKDLPIAAAIASQDPAPTRQSITIDVSLKENHPCTVSLYFLDADNQGRRSAIELFDLKSLELLAPVTMVRHYEKGKYIRFTCNRSVRIRINHVRGENAVVSGIFFDDPS